MNTPRFSHKQRQAFRAIEVGNRPDLAKYVLEKRFDEIRKEFPEFDKELLHYVIPEYKRFALKKKFGIVE